MSKKKRIGSNPLLPFIQDSSKQAEPQANCTQVARKTQAEPHAKRKQAARTKHAEAHAIKEKALGESGRTTRTRRTYWLTSLDIERIEQLAEATGEPRHNIIAAAVSMLHGYVFE